MSLVLDTGTMKYRENPNQPWRPLVIKAGMNWESMADTYDPDNGTYEVGQYVLEEGMMYRCVSEITTPETWTPAHWTSVNVGDELSSFIIISDDQPTDETNKIWIAETTTPFGVQVPTMDDHNALDNTLDQLGDDVTALVGRVDSTQNDIATILQDPAQATFAEGAYVVYNNHLYTVNQGGIPAGTAASAYYPDLLTAVSGGGLNSVNDKIVLKIDAASVTGIGKTGNGGYSNIEAIYITDSFRTGPDTIQLIFYHSGSLHNLYFGRNGVAYDINGSLIWQK